VVYHHHHELLDHDFEVGVADPLSDDGVHLRRCQSRYPFHVGQLRPFSPQWSWTSTTDPCLA
jgi:hypothetical protein